MATNATLITEPLLRTRQHFKALDGLRGVAALAVVTFHFMEMAIYDYSKLFIGNGWLAVDFFFCLSGFVIAYAYDNRIAAIGLWQFCKLRLIRLHPMVVFGSVLGLIALFLDPFVKGQFLHGPPGLSAAKIALMFVASILLIPYPAMHDRGFNNFSLNAPAWSLFWEYVANIFYAVLVYRIARHWLTLVTIAAAVLLCYTGYQRGYLYGGWSGPTFWDGAVRIGFSFLAGMLVYRSKWIIHSKLGFTILSILLLLALMMPFATGGWIREAAVVIVYFPLLIALGAGAKLSPRAEKICTFLGNLSYPLYMTHYSVIWIFGNYYDLYKPDRTHLYLITAIGVVTMASFATLVMFLYDTPFRKYLTSKFATPQRS